MLKFTDDHEWLRIEGGVATVGITAHATEQLGDLVFVELPEGRAPVRGGAPVFSAEGDAEPVGIVTSGAYGPSLGGPMAMGYVPGGLAVIGTRLFAEVRGRKLPVRVAAMPFVKSNYKRA